MNLYDIKQIKCYRCGKFIGEVDINAEILSPKCGDCASPFPYGDDNMLYTVNCINNKKKI